MSELAIKYTLLGGMIYAAMGLYLLAAIAYLIRLRKVGEALFAVGFVAAAAALVLRWATVGHAPMQNLFEVFMMLGALVYPLSLMSRRWLSVPLPGLDALIAAMVLFPAALVFKADPQMLPPALQSWLFVPHVTTYVVSYVILFMAAAQAMAQLIDGGPRYELGTYNMVRFGFPLLTVGLVLGAVWGKLAWGDYWNWDPKELWSLASWLLFLGYLHFRHVTHARLKRMNSVWIILGCLAIIMTLLWVNISHLFAGMHSYA